MLTKVLQTLASGSVTSHADLARRLDVSEDMLTHMLGDLVRKGYVTSPSDVAEDQGCRGSCGGCKSCHGCPSGTVSSPRGWTLTAKGRRLASGEH
jgi:hypothetical protein